MESLLDYTLQSTPNPSAFLVAKHKTTGKLYYLQGIYLSDLNSSDQKTLTKKIKTRINLTHPNVLQFFEGIQHEEILYLKTEFCKFDTLSSFLQKECVEKDRQIHEQLLCRILYQTVLALKTVELFMGRLSLDTILLDEDFNIKLYNFPNMEYYVKQQKQKEVKMSQLGAAVFELCTLKPFNKATFEHELRQQPYSEAFRGLLTLMLKDGTGIKKHINKILCYPSVLLQASQWNKEDGCFMEYKKSLSKSSSSDLSEFEYSERLEKLRKREAAVRTKELLIGEQAKRLSVRERKVHLMERTAREKLQQAELYLKRSKEGSTSSRSNNSQFSLQSKKTCTEEVDSSYISIEESDIFCTSTKLQVNKIVKPSNFSRTMSERKIRFKVSPLKDRNFIRRGTEKSSLRQSRILEENKFETIIKQQKKKSLFLTNEYKKIGIEKVPCEVSNIGWSEETKKQAFDMLRMLNCGDKENVDIKHTVL
ncbi:serine/threonine-protein kinase Nek2-like [Euwallacea fornicatus]|uniref:serine/threonine-protein kinase Nek2-like n=1 Tax=Euwallacea fornicatus TaxID=995702 RepID=UPI00338E5DC2